MEGEFVMVNFGERLKLLRQAKGLTQKQLAVQLGISKSVVSSYENGFRYPSYEVLAKLASVFNTTTDYLLGVGHRELLDITGLDDNDRQILVSLIDRLKK
ncbi:MAG: helix-turn-helix transcriptional regulator [Clostridia bacterium]|nr:helix-turn-helix transcriptional regulator [Clostridia bacterium]